MISMMRLTGLALVAASALGLCTGAANAQGTPEQREACTPDAVRLCSDTIPDVGRTTACLRTHRSELSSRCQAVFEAAPAATPTREAQTKPEMARPKPKMRVARETPKMRVAAAPAPVAARMPMVRKHRRIAVMVAPAHPKSRRTTALRGNRHTREARRVVGGLCSARLLDAHTCGFIGSVITLAE